ncbi:MAG: two-component system response regulator [Myxococcaceae bacterium]|nr:two-component system response regulator [Myxococcaceae bacterium]
MRATDVLLVDDDPDFRDMIADLLRDEGCRVVEAGDGAAALEALETRVPDLIITDLIMPRMDGWQLFNALQKNSEWSKIPVAVISAFVQAEVEYEVRVLAKPIDLRNLLALLDELEHPRPRNTPTP